MRIGILETGKTPEELAGAYGGFPDIFARWLRAHDPALEFQVWSVVDGETPETPEAAAAWLVTGSRHAVYEDHAWIEPLKRMLRGAVALRRPVIGVCFGHQILAEALGGRADKSDKGWGVGPQSYPLVRRPAWMADAPSTITLNAIHQDQVTVPPPDATTLAASPFCPYAAFAYGDPEAPYAISIQPHPELDDGFTAAVARSRRGGAIPEAAADAALASFGRPLDRDWVARWFLEFWRRSVETSG